ncbi:MAG: excinuclease ABC subunit UvrC [Bacilli bacterium]|nr:excinuclease ABC subunit UvrC [Bacilli bacterium]
MSYLDYPILKQKISLLPDVPGSYQMKDENGTIIYVGKAKSLVKRVKQYFTRPQVGKVARMVAEIRDFDIIETNSEKEALLLEISLIHKYYPKYNIMLMDDRMYPYIALKKKDDPYLKIARSDKEKGYYYFGPFPNSSDAFKMIDLLNKIYPLRKCKTIPNKPCLYYHLGQCLAPCIRKVEPEEYKQMVGDITKFLNGDTESVTSQLKKKMKEYADKMEFERAAEYKKLLDAVKVTTSSQKIIFPDHVNRDIVGYSIREGYICVVFLLYRKGVLLGKNTYVEELEDDINDFLEDIIVQFYEKHTDHPKELIVPTKDITEVLTDSLDFNVISPTRGKKRDLMAMALENSKQMLDQHFQTARLTDNVLKLLEELQHKLGLTKTPLDIELYDNSHTQGYEPVGAMVKYINGEKAPQQYRKYKITQPNPQDDLASMREVLTRRFTRLKEENAKMPDLIILDGGYTQCQIGLEVKEETGVDIPLAGLQKNDKHETDTLINADTGEEIPLERNSPLFFLLMRMQDEIHRYAITYHRGKRAKAVFKTIYDDIKGIGDKRKQKLLDIYPTMESLEGIKMEELSQLVPEEAAQEILFKRDQYLEEKAKIEAKSHKR